MDRAAYGKDQPFTKQSQAWGGDLIRSPCEEILPLDLSVLLQNPCDVHWGFPSPVDMSPSICLLFLSTPDFLAR